MITREFGHGGWKAACGGAPPPLHVHATENPEANWYPAVRPALRPQPPGPEMIHIPIAAPFGDDPLDPAAQTVPRYGTAGMIARLNHEGAVR